MCCILSAIAGLGPRLGILIWYLLRPEYWQGTFRTWIWPLLGSLFLPWTTLAYVLVAQGGLTGLEFIVVVIGFFADLGTYGSSAYSNKDKIGYK